MGNPFEDLKHEHEAILFSLKMLSTMANLAKEGRSLNVDDALTIVDFLKEFADRCHHGKEEGILFPALERAGIPREGGPIGVMLHEHELRRGHIREMERSLRKEPIELGAFTRSVGAYRGLLTQHIEKENTVLFPMGERALDSRSQNAIFELFEEHEEKVIGAGRHEALHAMLDEFGEKYL
jgi:hemerythrin-like domain-containing protein